MKYLDRSFTLPAVGMPPEKCEHGWVNEAKGVCVMCGEKVPPRPEPQGRRLYSHTSLEIDLVAKP